MIAKDKERARERTQMLIDLRKRHAKPVKIAQELLKGQQSIRKTLEHAMQGAPRSVPQLATQTGLAADVVLWHIAALKKYGLVEEMELDESGDYYLYRLSKEVKP
jgi:predicted transcriptional regulator